MLLHYLHQKSILLETGIFDPKRAGMFVYMPVKNHATYHMSCFVEGTFDRIAQVQWCTLSYIRVMLRRKLREEMGAVYSVQVHSRSLLYRKRMPFFY